MARPPPAPAGWPARVGAVRGGASADEAAWIHRSRADFPRPTWPTHPAPGGGAVGAVKSAPTNIFTVVGVTLSGPLKHIRHPRVGPLALGALRPVVVNRRRSKDKARTHGICTTTTRSGKHEGHTHAATLRRDGESHTRARTHSRVTKVTYTHSYTRRPADGAGWISLPTYGRGWAPSGAQGRREVSGRALTEWWQMGARSEHEALGIFVHDVHRRWGSVFWRSWARVIRGRLPAIGRPNAEILHHGPPPAYARGQAAVGGAEPWPRVHPGVLRGVRAAAICEWCARRPRAGR